jgi:hypothetical protein
VSDRESGQRNGEAREQEQLEEKEEADEEEEG